MLIGCNDQQRGICFVNTYVAALNLLLNHGRSFFLDFLNFGNSVMADAGYALASFFLVSTVGLDDFSEI